MGEGRFKDIFQTAQDIVGVQHGIFRHLAQAICAMRHDVGQSAGEHAHLAVEGDHAAKAGPVMLASRFLFDQPIMIFILIDERQRRIRGQCFGQDNGPGTRPPATMWGRKCLVQVDVHGVNAQIAGAHTTNNRVEIRAVAIHIATRRMHRVRNFAHIPLE